MSRRWLIGVRVSGGLFSAWVFAALLVVACDDDPPSPDPPAPARWELEGDPTRGRTALAAHECNRCHEGTGLPAVPMEKHCVRCHTEILSGDFEAPEEALNRWQGNIRSLVAVPSLASTARFRRAWVAEFLQAPYDLRPGNQAMMPRLAIDEDRARDLATVLIPEAPAAGEEPDPALRSEGRRLFRAKGCATCHRFSGARGALAGVLPIEVEAEVLVLGQQLAPDLRFARERMQGALLARFIHHPESVTEASPMIRVPMTREEAEALASFVWHEPLEAVELPPMPEALPLLEREVEFAEVRERLFRKVCWHCHSDPDYALGDGGPGNTGGFGFVARGVNLAEYQDVMSGYRDPSGRRRSLFRRVDGGKPRIVAALWARHRELRGEIDPEVRGMPLGLPPIPVEEIQLLESWIAQGRPE
ncbi:MAG: c-type cytochrome [Myxococcota bacterium]